MMPRPLPRRAVLAAAAALATPAPAQARRSLTLVVGAEAGSPADLRARSFVPFLERHFTRHAIVVANLPGGGGIAAARHVAEAPARQPTLGLVTTPALLARCIQDGEATLPDRLRWFGPLSVEPLLLVVGPEGQGWQLASTEAQERLIGCGPVGGASHLAALQLAEVLPGTRVLPFASSAAARRAAAAGHVAAALLPASDLRRWAPGSVPLPLAVAAPVRLAWLPAVPTFAERGLPAVSPLQRGLVAPAGTPVAGRLAEAIRALRADPEFLAWIDEHGALPGDGDPAAWAERLAAERQALAAAWRRRPWVMPG